MPAVAESLDGLVEIAGPIRPGDTLVLRMRAEINTRKQLDEMADVISEAVKERLPEVRLVLLAGVEQVLVYRPES